MNTSARRVLVTGAQGFVGRQAVTALRSRGFEVHALSREREGPDTQGCHWHAVDLLNAPDLEALMRVTAPSHLLHFAWITKPGAYWTSDENPRWLQASLDLFEAFLAAGGRRVVYAGTCAEYDWAPPGIKTEASPLVPSTLYGLCKRDLCLQLEERSAAQGMSHAWGRIFFPFGPYERPERLIPSVIGALLKGETAECTHGAQIRDFLFVEDAGDAFAALLDSGIQGPINIGSGRGVSIRDLALSLGARLGMADKLHFGALPSPPSDPPVLVADVTRLERELGWKPAHTLEEGLDRTLAWWRTRSR